MHARYDAALTRLFVAVGFIWLLIMFDLTLSDYLTRGAVPGTLRESWRHGAWPALTNHFPMSTSDEVLLKTNR